MAKSKTEPRTSSKTKCLSTVLELLKCCTVEELDNVNVTFTLKTKSGDEQTMLLTMQKMADRNMGMSKACMSAKLISVLESRGSYKYDINPT